MPNVWMARGPIKTTSAEYPQELHRCVRDGCSGQPSYPQACLLSARALFKCQGYFYGKFLSPKLSGSRPANL